MAKKDNEPTLPKQQLTILAICRFAEPVAATSVNPYIPEMIQSFNVPLDQVATYTGWLSACFSLSQCLLAIAWGRASDRFGRKPMILLALTSIMVSSVFFGFSSSLWMAFVARSIQGLASGNVGIIRTAVAEMVPQKELQPRAFSIMPLVWNIGSIFGPSIGGSLVNPVKRYGGVFKRLKFLETYPFALPNLVISVFFYIGIMSGLLFFRETHEDKKNRRDYGLVLGKLITRPCTKRKRGWSSKDLAEDEAAPFLTEGGSELGSPIASRHRNLSSQPMVKKSQTGWRQVFSPQSTVNLISYTGLAMHSIAFDQILPVFMNYPTIDDSGSPVRAPFKFAGGFGIGSAQIGFLFTIYGFFGMIVQFAVFPPLARRFGVLRCFKACAITFPIVYVLVPFTSLIETNQGRQTVCLMLMLVKCVAGIFAFPCSTIMLTNSATSLKILGTLNGAATSISAIGRAAGPALAGAAFSIGVDHGYIILPFWVLAVVAIIAAVPIWWLVEMEGFSATSQSDDEDEEEQSMRGETEYEDQEGRSLLSTANDITSIDARTRMNAVGLGVKGQDEADLLPEQMPNLNSDPSRTSTQKSIQADGSSRRMSDLPVLTKTLSPIGTGPGVVVQGARKYSSDLGTTRSGFGTGGP